MFSETRKTNQTSIWKKWREGNNTYYRMKKTIGKQPSIEIVELQTAEVITKVYKFTLF